jgi:hypothetical protein
MNTTRLTRSAFATIFLGPGCLLLAGCPDIPEQCGENVARVQAISFDGPAVLESRPEGGAWSGYNVTVAVEPVDRNADWVMCYAVRDDDPYYKFFWAVDDVLDANVIAPRDGRTEVTLEGNFLLEERDDEVCGAGAIPGADKVRDCSGEDEAEVYLDVIGSDGPSSSTRTIRTP